MSLERLIDAAGNRACEGLRTLEDLARFVLDDADATVALKAMRHDLTDVVRHLPCGEARVWHRDTHHDVGTTVSTTSESRRSAPGALAGAATARATQALRTLEEAAKTTDAALAGTIEAMRYRLYDLGADLERRLGAPCRQWRLCLLLTVKACTRPWPEVLDACLSGGVDCVQVREKTMSDDTLVRHIADVVERCDGHDVPVIVNDRVDLAMTAGAAGVHLGRDDLSINQARRLCGRRLIIGATTHGPEEAQDAVAQGADYVGIGPIYHSTTKSSLTPAGLERLRMTLPAIGTTPHLAIGGITPDRVEAVRVAGGQGVAVSAALCASSDLAETESIAGALVRGLLVRDPVKVAGNA